MGRGTRTVASAKTKTQTGPLEAVDPAVARALKTCRQFALRTRQEEALVERAARAQADPDDVIKLPSFEEHNAAEVARAREDARLCAQIATLNVQEREAVEQALAAEPNEGLAHRLGHNARRWVENREWRARRRAETASDRIDQGLRLDTYLLSAAARNDRRELRELWVRRPSSDKVLQVRPFITHVGLEAWRHWRSVHDLKEGERLPLVRELAQEYRDGYTFLGSLRFVQSGAQVGFPHTRRGHEEFPLPDLFAQFLVITPRPEAD